MLREIVVFSALFCASFVVGKLNSQVEFIKFDGNLLLINLPQYSGLRPIIFRASIQPDGKQIEFDANILNEKYVLVKSAEFQLKTDDTIHYLIGFQDTKSGEYQAQVGSYRLQMNDENTETENSLLRPKKFRFKRSAADRNTFGGDFFGLNRRFFLFDNPNNFVKSSYFQNSPNFSPFGPFGGYGQHRHSGYPGSGYGYGRPYNRHQEPSSSEEENGSDENGNYYKEPRVQRKECEDNRIHANPINPGHNKEREPINPAIDHKEVPVGVMPSKTGPTPIDMDSSTSSGGKPEIDIRFGNEPK